MEAESANHSRGDLFLLNDPGKPDSAGRGEGQLLKRDEAVQQRAQPTVEMQEERREEREKSRVGGEVGVEEESERGEIERGD